LQRFLGGGKFRNARECNQLRGNDPRFRVDLAQHRCRCQRQAPGHQRNCHVGRQYGQPVNLSHTAFNHDNRRLDNNDFNIAYDYDNRRLDNNDLNIAYDYDNRRLDNNDFNIAYDYDDRRLDNDFNIAYDYDDRRTNYVHDAGGCPIVDDDYGNVSVARDLHNHPCFLVVANNDFTD
jgi:hypothetical protein